MVNEPLRQIDAFTTPGTLLKAARQARGMTAREAADQLHMMPDYVKILEQDDYQALRSPAFARGYIKAYCRLLELDEGELLALFDHLCEENTSPTKKRIETKPLQLQRTGVGVVIGLCVLLLLILALWWWQGGQGEARSPQIDADKPVLPQDIVQPLPAGESE